jgi:hypothetical protein
MSMAAEEYCSMSLRSLKAAGLLEVKARNGEREISRLSWTSPFEWGFFDVFSV